MVEDKLMNGQLADIHRIQSVLSDYHPRGFYHQ